jgi:hypothetical protein
MSSWRFWSAAPSGGTSWPSSTSRPSSSGREGGSSPTLRAKAGASARSPSPSGSSRESTLGCPGPASRNGRLLRSVEEREGQSRHAERLGGLVGSLNSHQSRSRSITSAPTTSAVPAPSSAGRTAGDLEQIKFLLGHSSIQTTELYLGSERCPCSLWREVN